MCKAGKWISSLIAQKTKELDGVYDYVRYQRALEESHRLTCSQEWYGVHSGKNTPLGHMLYCVDPGDDCSQKVDMPGIQGLYRVPKVVFDFLIF